MERRLGSVRVLVREAMSFGDIANILTCAAFLYIILQVVKRI